MLSVQPQVITLIIADGLSNEPIDLKTNIDTQNAF